MLKQISKKHSDIIKTLLCSSFQTPSTVRSLLWTERSSSAEGAVSSERLRARGRRETNQRGWDVRPLTNNHRHGVYHFFFNCGKKSNIFGSRRLLRGETIAGLQSIGNTEELVHTLHCTKKTSLFQRSRCDGGLTVFYGLDCLHVLWSRPTVFEPSLTRRTCPPLTDEYRYRNAAKKSWLVL